MKWVDWIAESHWRLTVFFFTTMVYFMLTHYPGRDWIPQSDTTITSTPEDSKR